jgi:hypothetical protein
MQALLDMAASSLDIEPLDVREGGHLTVEYGRYRLGIEPPAGEPMTDIGKYVVVHETAPRRQYLHQSNARPAA